VPFLIEVELIGFLVLGFKKSATFIMAFLSSIKHPKTDFSASID